MASPTIASSFAYNQIDVPQVEESVDVPIRLDTPENAIDTLVREKYGGNRSHYIYNLYFPDSSLYLEVNPLLTHTICN